MCKSEEENAKSEFPYFDRFWRRFNCVAACQVERSDLKFHGGTEGADVDSLRIVKFARLGKPYGRLSGAIIPLLAEQWPKQRSQQRRQQWPEFDHLTAEYRAEADSRVTGPKE